MKDYRQLFGYAAILFGLGFLVRSFLPAAAISGPTISTGENPSRSFYGEVSASSTADLLTTASDQVFIVTSCYLANTSYLDIYSSGTMILDGELSLCSGGNNSLSNGRGRLVVESGTTLRVRNTYQYAGFKYYIEGHYAYAP